MQIELVYFTFHHEWTIGEVGNNLLMATARRLSTAIEIAFEEHPEAEVWIRGKALYD